MFTSIAGRAVVVTGATRGIGKGIARVFAGAGGRVLIAGRDADAAKATAAELSAGGAEVSHVRADVSHREDCQRIAATAAERLGGIDVLCANAGIFPSAPLAEMTDADIDEVLGTNLRGTILSVQACLPALAASGHGRVILTSSITGPITGFPGWAPLRRQQGRTARVPAYRRDRAGRQRHHDQRGAARQHHHRGPGRPG